MKNWLLSCLLGCTITLVSKAQISLVPAEMAKHLPSASAVVKDSSGRRHHYDDWTYLMATGRYNLSTNGKIKEDETYPEYLLYSKFDAEGNPVVTEAMKRHRPAESEQFHAGDVFKPFNEKDITGQRFDLRKPTGKVYVINFWFINCEPCRNEMFTLNKLVEQYKDNKDVVFIAIGLDRASDIKDFLKKTPFNYHIIDYARSLAESYGVHLYPTHVVVNKEGKVVYSCVAAPAANPYWIIKTVDEALQSLVTQ